MLDNKKKGKDWRDCVCKCKKKEWKQIANFDTVSLEFHSFIIKKSEF